MHCFAAAVLAAVLQLGLGFCHGNIHAARVVAQPQGGGSSGARAHANWMCARSVPLPHLQSAWPILPTAHRLLAGLAAQAGVCLLLEGKWTAETRFDLRPWKRKWPAAVPAPVQVNVLLLLASRPNRNASLQNRPDSHAEFEDIVWLRFRIWARRGMRDPAAIFNCPIALKIVATAPAAPVVLDLVEHRSPDGSVSAPSFSPSVRL